MNRDRTYMSEKPMLVQLCNTNGDMKRFGDVIFQHYVHSRVDLVLTRSRSSCLYCLFIFFYVHPGHSEFRIFLRQEYLI